MIADHISNVKLYQNLSANLAKGFEFIKQTDLNALEPGEYQVTNEIKAIVAVYQTKTPEEGKPETHKKFIDIQYIISGEELIGYAPLMQQQPSTPYNHDKDVAFYTTKVSLQKLTAGMFAVYFPTDIHMPNIQTNQPSQVKKLVIKVPV